MRRGKKNKLIDFWGALMFFVLIATVSQTAVLTFAYLQTKTQDNALIAVLILVLIIILALICVVIDAIRRKVMVIQPTNKILAATEKITRGDFTVKLEVNRDPKSYSEYDLIMQNLNVMTAELKKMEILRSDFISNVSHEIKTPLAIVQSYANMLKSTQDEEERQKYLQIIISATKKLSELISNILKLNKLESSKTKPANQAFNLTTSLGECVLAFEDVIESKNINLECELDDVIISSDQALLELVWNNLISNAVKFTGEGGNISIKLKKWGYNAIITVSDNGCGMNAEEGKRIFEKFYQADTSHSKQGNGLGLALVKRVIDILGAQIKVESEVGKGSTFSVTLVDVVEEKL